MTRTPSGTISSRKRQPCSSPATVQPPGNPGFHVADADEGAQRGAGLGLGHAGVFGAEPTFVL